VVRHETNKGIYAAFTRCYQEARGTHIYAPGSDGQWLAENVEPMLRRLVEGADLVVGVRNNRYAVARRIVSFGFCMLRRVMFGVTVRDAGSINLGRREIFLFDLTSTNPFFEAERIIGASREGYRVDFVPIRFTARSGGKATGRSWKNIRASIRDLFRCLALYGVRGGAGHSQLS
jgi:hypothetical protein